MIVDCVKPAEDGRGMIVRLYEPYGASGTLTVTLPKAARVTEVSPLEEARAESAVTDSWEIACRPFEIRSYRIEP